MKLIKFTDSTNGKPVYVNIENVDIIKYNPTWSNSDGSSGCTEVIMHGAIYYISEHMAEVVAYLQGGDPYAAQVLFKKSTKDEA